MYNKTEPLHNAHDEVNRSAGIICAEFADEVVEFSACWADAEEEGYFNEEDYERRGEAYTAKDDEQRTQNVEDICYAQRKAQDHGNYSGPLCIDAPIPRPKLFRQCHCDLSV